MLPSLLKRLSVVSLCQFALAVGGVPLPAKFCTAKPLTPTKALPNWASMSSNNVSMSRVTDPVFSTNSINGTSKLSPFGTASPANLATPISGTIAGVGASMSIPDPSSRPLWSLTWTVEPSKFCPSPVTVAVLVKKSESSSLKSGSTTTSNVIENSSPAFSTSLVTAASNTSKAVLPAHAGLISDVGIVLVGASVESIVGVVTEMNAKPNCDAISSVKLRLLTGTVPLF